MKCVIVYKQRENGISKKMEVGPQDKERLGAIMDIKKNLMPGEYIDIYIFGRSDSVVCGSSTSTGEESSESQLKLLKGTKAASSESQLKPVTGTKTRPSCEARIVPRRTFGKKVRSWFGKLSKLIDCDCFCKKSSTISATGDDEVEDITPVTVASYPHSRQEQQKPSHDTHVAGADTSEESPSNIPYKHHVEQAEIVEEQEEEGASNRVDNTPRRVKSKVDSGDDLSVIEKGMVVKTLTKLSSSGSCMFKETRSLVSEDESRKIGDLHVGNDSCLGSKNSAEVCQDSRLVPSREEGKSQEGSMMHIEVSSSSVNGSAHSLEESRMEEDTSVEAIECIPGDNDVPAGGVKSMISLLEDDTSGLAEAVVAHKIEARELGKSSTRSSHHDEACVRSAIELENVQADVEALNGGSDVHNDLQCAPTTIIPSTEVKPVGSSSQSEWCDVPDKAIIRKVSSSIKVTAMPLEAMPLNNEKRGVTELEEPKTAPEVKGVEQQQLLSEKELSKQLYGRVQKMKYLFEASSSEKMITNDYEEVSNSETHHIPAGLSCDSGVLSSEDGNDDEATEVEGHRTMKHANAREDTEHNDGDETREISHLVAGKDAAMTGHASEFRRSGRGSSEVDLVDEFSSDSDASSDILDLSQPISHFVGSCAVM